MKEYELTNAPGIAAAAPHPQTAPDAPISCKEQFSHTFPLEVELVRIPSDTIPHISESANDGYAIIYFGVETH